MTEIRKIEQEDPAGKSLEESLAVVRQKVGIELLADDALLLLCAEQIVRSYTRDEKGYA